MLDYKNKKLNPARRGRIKMKKASSLILLIFGVIIVIGGSLQAEHKSKPIVSAQQYLQK
ncbi:hypothetical protein OKIT_0295 [Oenococcus kitaharae DSM 17330]|uniref:Uncharacterized protein n=1 Tax=Oenococcus kitaharae DSM 17330 TaxID=1045004 RepID=G9WIX0_9LACO|nr:hypothetical protein OKIT_0295 [Oenococcus kitaharae DSM 17330]